jgi:hypothetical protein
VTTVRIPLAWALEAVDGDTARFAEGVAACVTEKLRDRADWGMNGPVRVAAFCEGGECFVRVADDRDEFTVCIELEALSGAVRSTAVH